MKKGDKIRNAIVRQAEVVVLRCNFCGARHDKRVAIMVASPLRLGPVVYICDRCVETCMEIIMVGFREATVRGFRFSRAEQIEPLAQEPPQESAPGSGSAPKSPPPDSLADLENQATSLSSGRAAKIT